MPLGVCLYAVYGGFFIVLAWVLDGDRPDVGDLVGGFVWLCLAGIMATKLVLWSTMSRWLLQKRTVPAELIALLGFSAPQQQIPGSLQG